MKFHQLQFKEPFLDKENGLRRIEVGERARSVNESRCVLLLGETGAGKSTFINALVNFYYGVRFEHNFRLKLIGQET